MLEFLVELVLEFFGDVILQGVVEVLVEYGFESLRNLLRPQRTANPFLAGCGLMLLGGILGLIFALVLPHRFLPISPVPGLSLVLAPLGVGLLMHLFGTWRRKHGGNPTFLATFWGGAVFAFSMAWVRWLMVGNH